MSPMRTFLTLAFGEGKLPAFIALRSLATTKRTLAKKRKQRFGLDFVSITPQ